ncbi:hypothetical protein [Tepidiforma bonchosmolovskayae]|uniref:hypothetical protein n=1 Tax=Tepidiforma bonchosmolovskayae TaxID=2601677 RepID=UPI00178891A1|nr:hypothetical protein [Tepidiforma bonchosmolovskayae]
MSAGPIRPKRWPIMAAAVALVAAALLLPAVHRGLAQEPDGTLVIAKVIPGDPGDTTTFFATLAPCAEPKDGKTFGFSQLEPASVSVAPDCWLVSEQPPRGYLNLGWSLGQLDKNGSPVCPEAIDSRSTQAEVKVGAADPVVVCFYNQFNSGPNDQPRDDANLFIAKVVPGSPGDTTVFQASYAPCDDPKAANSVTFSQGAPAGVAVKDGCWQAEEVSLPAGYVNLGWAPGRITLGKDGTPQISCPDSPTEFSSVAKVDISAKTGAQAVCFYNRANERPTDPWDPPPAGSATLTVAKVIPGHPDDDRNFQAWVSQCGDNTDPIAPPPFGVGFSQPSPGTLPLEPGCWSVSEEILPRSPYGFAGWALGAEKGGELYCPDGPESAEQPVQLKLGAGDRRVICFYNTRLDGDPPVEKPTLTVAKVIPGSPGDAAPFTAAVAGVGTDFTANVTFAQGDPGQLVLAPGGYTVRELPRTGYRTLGWSYGRFETGPGGPPCRTGCDIQTGRLVCPAAPDQSGDTAPVTIEPVGATPEANPGAGEHVLVCFYNEPLTVSQDPAEAGVTIRVAKTENIVGFERPGAGWEFTLSGCGIEPRTAVTGPDGVALFENLPPAVGCSYTVAETLRPGWTAQFAVRDASPRQPGEIVTLAFLNIRDWNPPCMVGCYELPPSDPPPPPPAPPAPPQPAVPAPPAAPTPPAQSSSTETPPADSSATGAPPPAALATPLPPRAGNAPAAGRAALPGPAALAVLVLLSSSAGLAAVALARRST